MGRATFAGLFSSALRGPCSGQKYGKTQPSTRLQRLNRSVVLPASFSVHDARSPVGSLVACQRLFTVGKRREGLLNAPFNLNGG